MAMKNCVVGGWGHRNHCSTIRPVYLLSADVKHCLKSGAYVSGNSIVVPVDELQARQSAGFMVTISSAGG